MHFENHKPQVSFWKNLFSLQYHPNSRKDSFRMAGGVSTVKTSTKKLLSSSVEIKVTGLTFFVMVTSWIVASVVFAQEKTSQTQTSKDRQGKEIILDEIQIEAILEKPNVAILPTRERLEFGEFKFVDRSFLKEIRELPDEKVLFADKLYSVKKITNYKKLINTIIGNNK